MEGAAQAAVWFPTKPGRTAAISGPEPGAPQESRCCGRASAQGLAVSGLQPGAPKARSDRTDYWEGDAGE